MRQLADARGNFVGGKQNPVAFTLPRGEADFQIVRAGGRAGEPRAKARRFARLQRGDPGDEGPVIEFVLVAIEQRYAHRWYG